MKCMSLNSTLLFVDRGTDFLS